MPESHRSNQPNRGPKAGRTLKRSFRGILAFAAVLALPLSPQGAAHPAGRQKLSHHLTASDIPAGAPAGEMTGKEKMALTLSLPSRDPAGLDDFIHQVSDPRNPQYAHYLNKSEFADRFGPSASDYRAVLGFAASHGLKVEHTHPSRVLVTLSGTSAQVQEAFHVHLRRYRRPDGTKFFAPDEQPSVDLDVPLAHIGGLDNYRLPKRVGPKTGSVKPLGLPKPGPQNFGSSPGQLYWGNDYRNIYAPGVSLDGAGQTIALFAEDGFNPDDIQKYKDLSGLKSSTPIKAILVDGADGSVQPPGAPPYDNRIVSEVSMDIELALSMAPGLSQLLVYEGKPSELNQYEDNVFGDDILATIADDDAAQIVSCSYSFLDKSTMRLILQQMAAQGQSFFISSGDVGAYPTIGVFSSQDQLYCTSVGFTDLTTNPDGSWGTELGDSFSGGGTSQDIPLPTFQQNISMAGNGGSLTQRNFPDVAMVGQFILVVFTDVKSGIPNPGYTISDGGSSAACPLWAGFMALVNQQRAQNNLGPIGFANKALYDIAQGPNYHTDFHDIQDGNNGTFNAVPGYDLVTGLGSPAGQPLINDLCPGCVPALTSTPTLTPVNAVPTPTFTETTTGSPTPAPFVTRSPTPTPTNTQALPCVPTGALWTEPTAQAGFSGRDNFGSVAYNNRMWVFGGETALSGNFHLTMGDVWSSSDGANWTQATADAGLGNRLKSRLVVFDPQDGQGPRMYLIGGFRPNGIHSIHVYNDIHTSFDGIHWTLVTAQAPFTARVAPACAAFRGRLWLMGGQNSDDVWSTADGVHWVQNVAHVLAWSDGFFHETNATTHDLANVSDAVVLDGQIWAISQSNCQGGANCIFSSPDGYTWYWSQIFFPTRDNFAFYSYAGKLWVAGGTLGNQLFNDVLSVEAHQGQGTSWTAATTQAPFTPRGLQGVGLVFQDQMWVLGGTLAGSALANDVWKTKCSLPIPVPTVMIPNLRITVTPVATVYIPGPIREDPGIVSVDGPTITVTGSLVLPPGNYQVQNLILNGSISGTGGGLVNIWFTGSVVINGQFTGSLYGPGPSANGAPSDGSVLVNSGGTLNGAVVAPDSLLTLNPGSTLTGGLVALQLTDTGATIQPVQSVLMAALNPHFPGTSTFTPTPSPTITPTATFRTSRDCEDGPCGLKCGMRDPREGWDSRDHRGEGEDMGTVRLEWEGALRGPFRRPDAYGVFRAPSPSGPYVLLETLAPLDGGHENPVQTAADNPGPGTWCYRVAAFLGNPVTAVSGATEPCCVVVHGAASTPPTPTPTPSATPTVPLDVTEHGEPDSRRPRDSALNRVRAQHAQPELIAESR